MPDESVWRGFFDPDVILYKLGVGSVEGDIVEFGCGYGTFTLPAARMTPGTVYAMDIDPSMVALTRGRAVELGLANVQVHLRDFVAEGTGLDDASAEYAMVFNLLHIEQPVALLAECYRVLQPGGRLGVIHWNHDPATPRGPSLAIRPRPEECVRWGEQAGFHLLPPGVVDLPPHHYGFVCRRP